MSSADNSLLKFLTYSGIKTSRMYHLIASACSCCVCLNVWVSFWGVYVYCIKFGISFQKLPDCREYFNFRFFKLPKTSVVMITIFGLLMLTFTLFCMKRQNDYTLLNNEHFRQSLTSEWYRQKLIGLGTTQTRHRHTEEVTDTALIHSFKGT